MWQVGTVVGGVIHLTRSEVSWTPYVIQTADSITDQYVIENG